MLRQAQASGIGTLKLAFSTKIRIKCKQDLKAQVTAHKDQQARSHIFYLSYICWNSNFGLDWHSLQCLLFPQESEQSHREFLTFKGISKLAQQDLYATYFICGAK